MRAVTTRSIVFLAELSFKIACKSDLRPSSRGGDEPLWAPGESKLYYRDDLNVIAVSYSGASGFQVTGRQPLFPDVFVKRSLPHANYDVAPDGWSFLFVQSTATNDAIVVYNWIAEVRTRLKDAGTK